MLLFIVFLLFFIFVEQHIFFFISVLGCLAGSIAMICVLFKVLRQPKVMLEYDDTYLYFNEYQKKQKSNLKKSNQLKYLNISIDTIRMSLVILKLL